MLATLAPLRPLRLFDDHLRLLLPPYPTVHDFPSLYPFTLGNLLGMRSAKLVLAIRTAPELMERAIVVALALQFFTRHCVL